jgi:hypothetical protein
MSVSFHPKGRPKRADPLSRSEADKAISGLAGKDLKGRPLTINGARPRADRPRTSGGSKEPSALFYFLGDFHYNRSGTRPMEKALQVIEEMTRLGTIKAYAIGGGIAATYYIEPILTYDLDIFFTPVKEGLAELAPIYEFARGRGYVEQAEALLIEGFPVQFIPAYNDLVREAVADAATLRYRDVEAKVVKAEYLAAIALQTGRAKDRERVARLLESEAVDRAVLAGILERHGLTDKLNKLEGGADEK